MKRQIAFFSPTLLFLLFPVAGYAASADFSNWIYNIAAQVPNLRALVVAIAFVSGIGFVIGAIMKLKVVAQSSSSMMQRESVTGPLVHFLIGVVLIYFAGFVNVGAQTVFGANVAYEYASGGSLTSFDALIAPVIDITKLIGMIAFLKGLYLLAKLGQQSQQGSLSKGLVHIIGGVLAMNIEATYTILMNTLQGL